MKICTKCKQEKPLSEYYKHNKSRDKLTSQCKSCLSTRYRGSMREERKLFLKTTIIDEICNYFGVATKSVFNTQKPEFNVVKFCIYTKLKTMGLSLPQIGVLVKKDHTSVLYMIKKGGFMKEFTEMQMELFSEYDASLKREKTIREKSIKEIYNKISFDKDQAQDEKSRILAIANHLEVSFCEALESVNKLLENGFKWVPIYNQNTQRKVIT